ncbi:uncharacterized protein [Triticum aestivum]|uniref:uncharacterized protein isoform X1 n=1 Tax=Triticum aestivum TaxID=4565 RepID=UPI001D033FCF|nr:uncharacterized protein LOC123087971 isoform X1 [Triticum aestivum]
MGLLDQLWDDTVAGPRPDHGFSKLRKYSSFSPSSPAAEDVAPAVTRSITIARTPSLSLPSGESSSVPSSPGSAPDSPFAAALIDRDRFCPIGDASIRWGKKNMDRLAWLVPRARSIHRIKSVIIAADARMSGNLLFNLKLMFYLNFMLQLPVGETAGGRFAGNPRSPMSTSSGQRRPSGPGAPPCTTGW